MDVVGQIMGNYSAKQHFFGLCWMALDSSSNPTLSAILRQALATLAASAGQAVSSERSRRRTDTFLRFEPTRRKSRQALATLAASADPRRVIGVALGGWQWVLVNRMFAGALRR